MLSYTANAQSQKSNENRASELDIPVVKKSTGNPDYDELVYTRNLIEYFRAVYDLPEYVNTGDKDADILAFNKALKVWYQNHSEFIDVLGMKSYSEFVKYDISCYPPPPDYTKSETEKAYRDAFQHWMAHHPEAPKLLGDDMASKEKFEREKAMFYELYFKK
jgi:hypothetical protein